MWNLTEEKIEELTKQMNQKREEHATLKKLHPFQLWEQDLDEFLLELDKYEEQEEKDRLAVKSVKNTGKAQRKKAPKQKGKDNDATTKPAAKLKGKENDAKPAKKREPKPKDAEVDPNDFPLRERLALNAKANGLDIATNNLLQKRTLKQTNIYDELIQLQKPTESLQRKKTVEPKQAPTRNRRKLIEDEDEDISDSSSDFSL